jgi:hypothetical protein
MILENTTPLREIHYIKNDSMNLNDYLDIPVPGNLNDICFIYFHLGENAKEFLNDEYKKYAIDEITRYNFIKSLKTKFNININEFDLSHIFNYYKQHNQEVTIKIHDLTDTYINLKYEYLKEIIKFLQDKKCD